MTLCDGRTLEYTSGQYYARDGETVTELTMREAAGLLFMRCAELETMDRRQTAVVNAALQWATADGFDEAPVRVLRDAVRAYHRAISADGALS